MLSFTSSPDASQNIQTMRLREDPPPITQRTTKKRKGMAGDQQSQQAQPPPDQQQPPPPQQQQQQQPIQHVLPPPHALMHPLPGSLPPGYPYTTDYTPGGLPPGNHPGVPIQQPQQPQQSAQQVAAANASNGPSNRALSNSKRAEQNRKAQRAFRERRDQHVKALESRSQLLDAALASADEANRRWEECRALVDQLRVENAALRAALSQAHLLPPNLNNPNHPSAGQGDDHKGSQSMEQGDAAGSEQAQEQSKHD